MGTRWVGNSARMWRLVAVVASVALLVGGAAQGARKTAPSNTSAPTISGTAREGETLTASSGSWSGTTPITFAYRWQRCNSSGGGCSNIGGASNQTYKLAHGDVGHAIRVSVTATNGDGSANAVSSATGVVTAGKEPKNTSPPTISGTAKDGETLTATTGSWNNNPTSFEYRWRRCNASGDGCKDTGQNKSTYKVVRDDVGSTIRVRVTAKNAFGSNDATSAPTAVVAPAGALPANTVLPVISGTVQDGQNLTASTGTWSNSPTKFAYQWLRCDSAGNSCATIGSGQMQRLTSSDVGHTIRVTVSATNQFGTSKATSAPTAVVAAALPGGAIKLPSGLISFPVQQVSLPQRLIISSVRFAPSRLTSRTAFTGRFRVSDTRGYVIRGALVYAIGLPYGWVRNAAEVTTGTAGWATITLLPTRLMPLHRAALVLFVRARKPGDNLLAGVSTRRLVQVRIG
jgi:hypothetical protein